MTSLIPVKECATILQSKEKTVKEKYDILYHLRTHANEESATALKDSYPFLNSELLEHEVMFILGQIKLDISLPYLISKLNDEEESPVVRHEAGEALSNFLKFEETVKPLLENYKNHKNTLISSTAQIALKKLEYSNLREKYGVFIPGSLEPAAPFEEAELMEFLNEKNYIKEGEFFIWPLALEILSEKLDGLIEKLALPLERMLFDDSLHEFYKYRLLYFFRNKGDTISAIMLSRVMEESKRSKTSPLLRHEVIFSFN